LDCLAGIEAKDEVGAAGFFACFGFFSSRPCIAARIGRLLAARQVP